MMTRKPTKRVVKSRKPKFALIWWVNTPYRDIIAVKLLGKNDTCEGDTITLPWKNKVTGQSTRHVAKVLAFDDSEEKLASMFVNERGEIHDPSQQIFSADVINEREELARREKIIKGITESNKRKLDEELKLDSGIFNQGTSSELPLKKRKDMPTSTLTSKLDSQSPSFSTAQNTDPIRQISQSPHANSSNSVKRPSNLRPANNPPHQGMKPANLQLPSRNEQLIQGIPSAIYQSQHYPSAHGHTFNVNQSLWNGGNDQSSTPIRAAIEEHSSQNLHQTANNENFVQRNEINYQISTPNAIPSTYIQRNLAGNHPLIPSGPTDGPMHFPATLTNSSEPSYNLQTPPQNPGDSAQSYLHDNNRRNIHNDEKNVNDFSIFSPRPAGSSQNILHPEQRESIIFCNRDSDIEVDNSRSSSEKSGTENNEPDPYTEDSIKLASRTMAGLIPTTVTKENLHFMRILLAAMEWNYENDPKNQSCENNFKVPGNYFQEDASRTEIWPGSKFYIPWSAKEAISRKLKDVDKKKQWKFLVRQIIQLVYGKNFGQFSARGSKVNSRPPINAALFRGLYDWAQSVNDAPLQESEFIGYLNKQAANARRDPENLEIKKLGGKNCDSINTGDPKRNVTKKKTGNLDESRIPLSRLENFASYQAGVGTSHFMTGAPPGPLYTVL